MKIIKNETTQGFEIYLNTSQGIKSVWLSPKQKLVVEEFAITTQLLTLNKRKIVRISNA